MLRTRLNDALKDALKAKNQRSVATLRLILAALKDRDIAARSKGETDGIDEEEILQMLQKMVRQNRESIEAYRKGNRPDLVDKENEEIAIIEQFLPKQLTPEETAAAVEEVLAETGASGIKDMGAVMGALKERYPGRMDFAKASALVKERLS
jgi:uncharacterized protein YqeY